MSECNIGDSVVVLVQRRWSVDGENFYAGEIGGPWGDAHGGGQGRIRSGGCGPPDTHADTAIVVDFSFRAQWAAAVQRHHVSIDLKF